jgi:hypothetical protein
MNSAKNLDRKQFGGLLALVLGVISLSPAHAQTLLFNNFNPDNSLTQAGGNGSAWEYSDSTDTTSSGFTTAEEFTVAPGTNYTLDSVTLGLQIDQQRPNVDPSNFAVQFLSSNSDGTPGAVIATLATGTSSLSDELSAVTFDSSGNIVLDAGSSYWVKVTPLTINTSSADNNNAVVWWYTTQPVISTSSRQFINSSGEVFDTEKDTDSGGYMQIRATAESSESAVPEPSTWAMLAGGVGVRCLARTRYLRVLKYKPFSPFRP